MDYGGRGRYSNTNAIEIVPEAFNTASNDAWSQSSNEQSIWPTKDDYQVWNTDSTPEQPSNKKPRTQPQTDSNSKSKAIGKMFFKTKLCCKFRAGTCPYITNCNFAHGMEELRPPPPNWQEIVAANEEAVEPREEHQIPILTSDAAAGEGQRSYKRRHCKKFFTEEGCPYGDMCTFLHDEQSKERESVAISLSPSFGSSNYAACANGTNQKPSNWKTKICNKWEMSGYCPFGSKCHFAHGAAELHLYGGGLVENEGRDAASGAADSKQAATPLKANNETNVASNLSSVARQDIYHMGLASQRTALNPRQGQRALQKWKGPDKISLIYGDWIDDFE